MLDEISPFITKIPTNLQPNPIEAHRQLALTLCGLAHGCSYQVIEDVLGVSKALASEMLNYVIPIMVVDLYNRCVALSKTIEERKEELKGFIENYSFPCIGAWSGFHVHVATGLRNHYSFKYKYTISNMGLVRYNKRFLHVTCNAPGSTHDARLLRLTKVFSEIQSGRTVPQKYLDLGERLAEIPLVMIGDTAFPQFAWLLKAFPESKDPKKRYFNVKLCSARVVTENAYGMLKGRWGFIYKK